MEQVVHIECKVLRKNIEDIQNQRSFGPKRRLLIERPTPSVSLKFDLRFWSLV